MAKKVQPIPRDNNIIRVPIEEAMPDNYLPYAIEVAKERALPDVRDGLKPVHRRILYGSYLLKAYPDRPYYKSARIVGDILGKFHPHGDTSVYDAMVILAQEFSTREPLIEGQGNWGSMDGDNPAAMRYTEARLSPIAMEMLKDIDKDTVEMVPNYSDSLMEPKVLPSRYPNLLVNGAFGIAVGLATNIPPHNLGEVTDGVLAYIDNPEITTRELMNYIKGPDLPTGGVLIGIDSMQAAYETGEGKVSLRAKTSIEKLDGGRLGIVITEFPYRRNKARILQTISEMTGDKKHQKVLDAITDIRDESDRDGIRAVIEFKKATEFDQADKILKYLFKKTDLQCNVSFNMVALADGKPLTLGLKSILEHYVNHQKDVITRRTKKELDLAEKRFHIVEGFIKAIDVLDEIIKTIRESKSKKDAGENLIAKFGFTEPQSDAILELMLYRLTGLEIKVFQKEYKELETLIKKLRKILSQEKELLRVVKTELIEVTDKYRNPRRTQIIEDDSEAKIDLEELIVVEEVMVTLSNDGFIKRMPLKTYNRSNVNADDIDYREGDYLKYLVKSNTIDSLLLFTNKGNMYQTKGINIPEGKWKDKGEKIDGIIKTLNVDNEKIVEVLSINNFMPNRFLQIITSGGTIKRCSLDKFQTSYSKLQATKLKGEDEVLKVGKFGESAKTNFLRVKTKLGLDFTLDLPKLEDSQRNLLGTQLFNLPNGDEVIDTEYVDTLEFAEFNVGITAKNTLKTFQKTKNFDRLKTSTDTLSEILFFSNLGRVFKVKTFMLQKVLQEDLALNSVLDGMLKGEKIVCMSSIKGEYTGKVVYSFTSLGLVKKSLLSEYEGDYSVALAYKLKKDDDKVISTVIVDETEHSIIMATKKGMAIKFASENVSLMGRATSGVTGISLKEDDVVIFADLVKENIINDGGEISAEIDSPILSFMTKNKSKEDVLVTNLKVQNRAGRGSSIITVALDDEVKEIVID